MKAVCVLKGDGEVTGTINFVQVKLSWHWCKHNNLKMEIYELLYFFLPPHKITKHIEAQQGGDIEKLRIFWCLESNQQV